MAQPARKFACSECGQSTGRWLGRCPGCGSFGTLVEETATTSSRANVAAARPVLRLVDVEAEEADRLPTGVSELDRVLGGGLVPASLVLVGGEPGVGKSTLLLMALAAMSKEHRALLVTGEESAAQVKLRDARGGDARRVRDRLCADALLGGDRLGAGLGLAGARGLGAAAPRREGNRRRAVPRRPRHEGRSGCGPARARAPRRLRTAVRGRPLPRAPRAPRCEEPLRLDQRARRLRDDRDGARRRPRPVAALRRRA